MKRNDFYIESLTKNVDFGEQPYYTLTDSDGFSSKHIIDEYEMIRMSENIEKFLIDRHISLRESMPDFRHPGPSNEELARYPALEIAWREFQVIQRMCKK